MTALNDTMQNACISHHLCIKHWTIQIYHGIVLTGMPNFSTSLFESFMVNMSNTYDHLSDSDLPDSPGQPIFTSSSLKPLRGENGRSNYNKPRNTKIWVINFQSVKNKTEELCNLIDSSNLSMIISTETWLQKDISSSEIFPDSYTVYRKDGYGGYW
jgi:hypothetical protein